MNGPIHDDFNQSALAQYGYVVYNNGTVSNGSNCYLTFGTYQPTLFANGTMYNGTACDSPLYPIRSRGGVGMAWSVLMILMLPLTMFCLHKHGKQYLPERKKFKAFSRKWQWYWLLVLQALAGIAGFFSIDLDRDYIQGSSLTAYGAIYCSTLPVSLGVGWELTRHWGSFEERKLDDADPFRFRSDDTRSKVHLAMPVIFYLFGFLAFFLTVLRNWSLVAAQDAGQSIDARWKAGGVFAVFAWLQIIAQIVVTRMYYKVPRVPLVIPALLICLAVLLAFHLSFMWHGAFSPFNVHSSVVYVALMGYLPIVLIVLLVNLSGFARENEDRVLIGLRNERDRVATEAIMRQQEELRQRRDSEKTATSSTMLIISPATSDTQVTMTDSEIYTEQNQKGSRFFRWFGTAPMKGNSFLSHNLKYIPCTSRSRKLGQQEVHQTSWLKRGHQKSQSVSAPTPAPKVRPPPRDIRENWKVKTVTGI